jgi:hypothetical protein
MISQHEIESYAVKLAEPGFEGTLALIGHLHGADLLAVLQRTSEIAREAAETAERDANRQEALVRLARAAGCPEDVDMVRWLYERGLLEEVDGELKFKKPKPRATAT